MDRVRGICYLCGGQVFWQECPTGGWWIHFSHPGDNHDAITGWNPESEGTPE